MSRISEKFTQLKQSGGKALIPFVSAGDPDLESTRRLVLEMEKGGADIIELGVPFSDPIADGPTIQKASRRALQQGATLKKILALVKELRACTQIPLVLMSYYNPVFKYGEKEFAKDALAAGVDGLIIPDLAYEEAGEMLSLTRDTPLDLVFLLAPTSPPRRIAAVGELSRGFVYYVSLTGITGASGTVMGLVEEKLAGIKALTDKPVAVGFGISTPEQAGRIAAWADGVIVGSAIVKIIEQNLNDREGMVRQVGAFVSSLKEALA